MRKLRYLAVIVLAANLLAVSVACSSSCSSKSATTVSATSLQKAAQAASAIADACSLLTTTETNLEQAKVITPQTALAILHARDGISASDQAFIAILKQVETGAQPLSVLNAAYQSVATAVTQLTGIVITDAKAQADIQVVLATIKSALAIIQTVSTGG